MTLVTCLLQLCESVSFFLFLFFFLKLTQLPPCRFPSELLASRRPSILVPSPNVTDDHQKKNAEVLHGLGKP